MNGAEKPGEMRGRSPACLTTTRSFITTVDGKYVVSIDEFCLFNRAPGRRNQALAGRKGMPMPKGPKPNEFVDVATRRCREKTAEPVPYSSGPSAAGDRDQGAGLASVLRRVMTNGKIQETVSGRQSARSGPGAVEVVDGPLRQGPATHFAGREGKPPRRAHALRTGENNRGWGREIVHTCPVDPRGDAPPRRTAYPSTRVGGTKRNPGSSISRSSNSGSRGPARHPGELTRCRGSPAARHRPDGEGSTSR